MTEWFTISGGLLYTLGLDSKLISCTPKIYYIWLFLSFFAGKASSFEKIQKIGSGPPLAISPSRLPKAQLTSALLESDAYPMSKTHFFILPPLSALRVSRISRKFVSGRVQRYLRRAHQRCGIPLLYWCPEFLLIKYDSIAFPAYDRKFLSRRILGVLFRTQKAISPSRSPTAWFTSASLAS